MQWLYYLLIITATLIVGWITWRSDKKKSVPRPWLTALLRSLLFASVLLLLLSPYIRQNIHHSRKPYLLFLQDNSLSMAKNLGNDSLEFRKQSEKLMSSLQDDFNVIPLRFAESVSKDSLFHYHGKVTDIARALIELRSFAPTSLPGAIVLVSDGQYNVGENPSWQQLPIRSVMYSLAVGDTTMQKDIRLGRVYANEVVSAHSQFQVSVDMLAIGCEGHSGNIQVTEGGGLLHSESYRINSKRFDKSISFTLPSGKAGWKQILIRATPASGEQNLKNNEVRLYVQVVEDQKKILLAGYAPHPDVQAIRQALQSAERYKVTTLFQPTVPDVSAYDAVILHQLPAQAQVLSRLEKPTWFILGSQSNLLQIGNSSQAFQARLSAFADLYPKLNTTFSLFAPNLGAAEVIDNLPPVWGPSSLKEAASVNTLISDKGNAPLWFFKSGNPTIAITAGEGLWRWRMYEYKNTAQHKVVDDLIRQTVAYLSMQQQGNSLRVELNKHQWSDQESVQMAAYLQSGRSLINNPNVSLEIKDSLGNKKDFVFEKVGSAYQLNIGLWAAGLYNYTASAVHQGKSLVAKGQFVVDEQPLEYNSSGADWELLNQLAHQYRGSAMLWTNMSALRDTLLQHPELKPIIEVREESLPLIDWRWMFAIILLLAASEWFVRKYWMAQ